MKQIRLTGKYAQGQVALVDDEDYDYLIQHTWFCSDNGYAHRATTLMTVEEMKALNRKTRKSTRYRMHRVIMQLSDDDPRQIDHWDRNRLNNQKSNLRIVTQAQNRQNNTVRSDAKSKYRGVSWHNKRQQWRANASVNGKRHEKWFHSKEEAHLYIVEWRKLNMPYANES